MTPSAREMLIVLETAGLVPPAPVAVFVAGSRVRGWGNDSSDLDLYVVVGNEWTGGDSSVPVALQPDEVRTGLIRHDGYAWDIQYWRESQVDQVIQKVSWRELDDNPFAGKLLTTHELDFLERLTYADSVVDADWLARRAAQVTESAHRSVLINEALHSMDLLIEDAYGQLRCGDVESAVLSSKMAFTCVVKALVAEHGNFARSSKWLARQVRETRTDILRFEEYWDIETMRTFDPRQPADWVLDVISVCRRIALKVSL